MANVLSKLYRHHLDSKPEVILFVDGNERVTAQELHEAILSTAGWLRLRGLGPGDVIAVWLNNRIEWIVLLFAIARIGGTMLPINTRYGLDELHHVLRLSGARFLFMEAGIRNREFIELSKDLDIGTLPALTHVAIMGDSELALDGLTVESWSVADARSCIEGGTLDAQNVSDPCILFTTSGSTGRSKLVAHRPNSLIYNSKAIVETQFYDSKTRLLAPLPFCGVFGLSGILANLFGGGLSIIMRTFDGPAAARYIMDLKVSHLYGPDAMYKAIFDELPTDADLGFAVFYGMASFTGDMEEFGAELIARGLPIASLYGSSELLGYICTFGTSSDEPNRLLAGGYPIGGQDVVIRVRDVESDALVSSGQIGEFEISTPSQFAFYLADERSTGKAFTDDGFFRTGDIGYLTDTGGMVFQGRKGDFYRLSGQLVSLSELENILNTVEGVEKGYVTVIQSNGKNVPVGFIVRNPSLVGDENDILSMLSMKFAKFKLPRKIIFLDAIPMIYSANGAKVDRKSLSLIAQREYKLQ